MRPRYRNIWASRFVPEPGEITSLLRQMSQGDRYAQSRLAGLVYGDLRRLAGKLMSRERPDHTLEPTALVNEAYLRLLGHADHNWNNRVHFFSVAAQVMRRILVDSARARRAEKRGAVAVKVPFDEAVIPFHEHREEVLALDEALERLSSQDPRQAKIVELRFFAGLTEEEIALLMGVSPRTIKREWNFAKAWLKRQLSRCAKPTEDR
jgi:RNA polymerase sigma-70 factor, ECF subfamily